MIVVEQKRIEFDNACGCIVDYDLLRKAIVWFQDRPTARLKKIYLHGSYPAVSIHQNKIHVHRLLAAHREGRGLKRDEIAHHINHNKLDARVENIEIVDAAEHGSHHNKGKKLSIEHRRRISEAGRLRKGVPQKKNIELPMREIAFMVDGGATISSIARQFNCDWSTIRRRLNEYLHEHPELLETE